ncbi:hypothetical protein [Nocardioides daphniae]|uniref:Uncharacterized protein n=1 Tax=Nocardioides daphniae TaxID=402297 RepID=A0ABQ1PZ05_9ACTN|nr:hypothetical protein [Nocardioides daphniae]GGD06861.1 hypothetical protein GCM10007231_02060 [Nocardioides daphniae]
MRRPLSPVLFTLGLLLLVVGAAGAALSGPDDTVDVVSQPVPEAKGRLVTTDPVVSAFRNVDLVVRARAEGDVFMGAAHRVDVDDMAATATHYEVQDLRPGLLGGLGGAVDDDGETLRAADLADLDIWQVRSRGEGEQQLVVPLADDPVGVVVLTQDATQVPTLSLGFRVAGLFWVSISLMLVGLVALVGWWLLRRQRGAGALPSERIEVPAQRGADDRATVPMPRLAAVVCVGALSLSGCALPMTAAVETPEKTAIPLDRLDDVVADHHDRRVTAEQASRFPKSDLDAWESAVEGPWLESARYATTYDRLTRKRSSAPRPATAGKRVWSPTFDSYPMWALGEVDGLEMPMPADATRNRRKDRAAKQKKGKYETSLVLFTRSAATAPWLVSAGIPLPATVLPSPADGAVSPTTDPKVVRRVQAVVERLHRWWVTGKAKGLSIDAESRRVRSVLDSFTYGGKSRPTLLEFTPWPRADERLRIIEVKDGHLAVATTTVRQTLLNPPGADLGWVGFRDQVDGEGPDGPYSLATMTEVVHLPARGKPRLVGVELPRLLASRE